ncbi:MAG: cyclic nucleotide-binding domain-containing protein, partial [Acidimicrobiia bacterium]|nr:cyclic nucleotide-binding domain-containing protein [Acidimicrobiia bacterium]
SLVAAPLATLVGIPLAFSIMGLVQPTIALVAWRWLRRSERAAVVHLESLETLMAVELFAELEPASLEALARVAEPQEATDGAVIIKEGERGNDMWIVESGRVAVTREGRTVRSLGRGEVVGEIALLSDRLRIATVTAEEKVKLLRIDRDGFIGALSTNQATSRAFRELALSRTTETLGE